MSIATEAKGALHKSTAAVRSTVQRRPRAVRRLARFAPEKLMRPVIHRHHESRGRRRVPIVPIVLAVGAVAVATVVLRRMLAPVQCASEETAFPVAEETVAVY
jgi:hypothetical protein